MQITKRYKLINNSLGWALGIIASAIYIITAEPTASWWDCGEYIATTYKMLIGHPPGAPTFQIIGRFFALFAGGDVTKVAFCINCMSAICSGLSIMFLFWTITMLGRKLVAKLGEMTPGREIAIFGSALVGALTYTFTDTFWFSAVEGEVYAMSSFFTALVFWCILKWDSEYDNPKPNVNPNRWIVLIFYLIGLSIGVHLLNLLTLPAIGLVVYFKLSKKATYMGAVLTLAIASFFLGIFFSTGMMLLIWLFITTPLLYLCIKKGTIKSKAEWGVFLSLCVSFVLLAVILFGIIPGVVNFAGKFEIFFVNSIGMPFNSGTIIYFLLIFGLIGWGIYYSLKKKKNLLFTGIFSFLFLLVGYSTFLTLVIRSNANPTIDENNPEDAVSLLAYLNREQYGTFPIIYGQSYNSIPIEAKDGNPVYVKDEVNKKYVITDDRKRTNLIYRDNMFFPRMWSEEKADEYVNWLKKEYSSGSEKDKEVIRHLNRNKPPTHNMNVKFLQTYQFNYMYFRYFMWNFSGRQNDVQGYGDYINGNWITGIPFIDNALVGNMKDLPPSMERPGHNKYYMLPLLLGIIGLVFYSRKDLKNSFIVLMLFAMTGLAIGFYLNMYTFQPRERDYAFAASFYAFSIWIGFGVFGLYTLFEKLKDKRAQIAGAVIVTLLCLGLVPGIMASENWDDHDRSDRYSALAFAKNYLDSCAPNAIIFTLGDNDTFPLWYAQEVEGYRTDVRVCNLSLLSAGWYIDQMKRKAYQSEPLPISMTHEQYRDGRRDMAEFDQGNNQFIDINTVLDYIKSPDFDNIRRITLVSGSPYRNGRPMPASFSIPVDKDKVIANGVVKPELDSLIVDRITWNSRTRITKPYLIMMDILATNNWERPVYYASTLGSEGWFGLEDYFQLEGMAYRLVPIKTARTAATLGRIDSDILYKNLTEVFNDHSRIDRVNNPDAPEKTPYPYLWGGFNDPSVYHSLDDVRMAYPLRTTYLSLAEQLIAEGDLERAEHVLDFGNQLLIDQHFPYKGNQWVYSIIITQYAAAYIDMGTPSGKTKGIAMLETLMDHLINEFNWLENSNDRTLTIRAEMISNNFTILSQFQYFFDDDIFLELQPKYKQLNLNKSADIYLASLNTTVNNKMKNMMDDLNGIVQELQRMSTLATIATLSGNDAIAQKAIYSSEQILTTIESVNPQIAQMMRDVLK